MRRLWPDTFVEEANLPNNISLLRKALAPDKSHQYIETVPRRGYRFVAATEELPGEPGDLIVEERTRITIEQEQDLDESMEYGGPLVSTSRVSPASASSLAQAAPQPFAIIKRWPLVITAGIIVVLAAAFFTRLNARRNDPQKTVSPLPFQHMEIKRVTASGKVKDAAISPDGRYIAYTLDHGGLQSIHLMQVDTSSSVGIRAPAEVDYGWPIFSPDGSNLYYTVRGENQIGVLYRSDVLGGVPHKVLTGVDSPITFSPDGKRLAFVRFYPERETAVVLADARDGSGEQKLASRKLPQKFSINGPSWSPDGQVIAILATSLENGARSRVFGVRVEDGDVQPLSEHEWSNGDRVAWLSDGTGLVLIAANPEEGDRRQIWRVSYPAGEVQRITNDLHEYDANNLSLSADSNTLVTVQRQTTSNIWVQPNSDPARARQLTFGSEGRLDGFFGLSWTPDGKIVYGSYLGNSHVIWIMDRDGSNQRQLTPAAGYIDHRPKVTADGRHVVFHSTRTGALEIWRIDIDGGNPVQLTFGGNNYDPSVSPDGKWVVFRSLADERWTLWKIPIDGGTPACLTDQPASLPAVSPDGRWVACVYLGSVALVPFRGGPPVQLFDLPRSASVGLGLKWYPDSQSLIVRDTIHGIWQLPLASGRPKHLTTFGADKIFTLGWSPDGKHLALARGTQTSDVVLIRRLKTSATSGAEQRLSISR
jgi:Tol biopolymer transport system component